MIELFFCCKSRKKNRNRCITAGKSCIKSGKCQEPVPWQMKQIAEFFAEIWSGRGILVFLQLDFFSSGAVMHYYG